MGQPYIGEVRIFGGNYEPAGWAFCNGQLLPIAEYDALFTLIGTTYGGDGEYTFALPDLRSRIPVGLSGSGASWMLGEMAGQETVTLLASQMPAHTHPVVAGDAAATSTNPTQNVWGTWADAPYSQAPPDTTMDPTAVSPAGGGQPHENRGPALGLTFIISLYGIYPSQA